MHNLEKEIEAIQIAMYIDIILNMLKSHEKISVNKMLVFAYLIKKEKFRKKVYNANNSQDVVYKAISLLSGEYREYCENIKFIIKAVHLLITSEEIELNGNLLHLKKHTIITQNLCPESAFMVKAIEESKKVTDRQFIKEVIANV